MTSEHFDQVLNNLLERRPFRVFTVELHGGERFEIDHQHATVVRDGVAVFIARGGSFVWFDHNSVSKIIDASSETAA
jgi:hypothetical protein